jgi:hypothetical protein
MPLTPLVLVSPTLPAGASTLSIDTSSLQFTVLSDLNTLAIDILVGTTVSTLSAPTLVGAQNQFTGPIAIPAATTPLVVQVTGRNYVTPGSIQNPTLTPTVQFELLYQQSALAVMIQAPSGITIAKGQTVCTITWTLPTYAGFDGVRVQYSTDPSGVLVPYVQPYDLISEVSSSENLALAAPVVTTINALATDGSANRTVTTLSTVQVAEVDFSSVSIPQSTVNSDIFYVILTTVVTDPTSGIVYESQASGPFTCGFVNLRLVSPTDFLALQKTNDIASRMISNLNTRFPNLDLSARAEARDLIVSTFSIELANISVREWFSRMANSISAMTQVDDGDGDGLSDSFTSSTIKQQIARAYGLSPSDCQTYIDGRFDIIGQEQAGLTRGGATYSTVDVLLFTYSRPTAAISIPVGTVVSTIPTATSSLPVSFETTVEATIDPSSLAAFYDAVNGWWAVTVPATCQQPGSSGNIGAGALRQVISGTTNSMSCTNPVASTPAVDAQLNSDYAAMILARLIAGKDSSTRSGYYVAARAVPGVDTATVIAANDLDMVRDWFSTPGKHVGGCVDIYTRGSTISQQVEQVPFTYQSSSAYGILSTYLTLTLIDPVKLRFTSAGATSPVYTPVEIRATSAGRTLYLGSTRATVDSSGIVTLDPTEMVYQVNADGSSAVWQINGQNATNLQVIQAIPIPLTGTYQMMARYQTGLHHQPALQPVSSVSSVTGAVTGMVDPTQVVLYHTSDFLLSGGSTKAGDAVTVSGLASAPVTATLTFQTGVNPTFIDTNMDIAIDANGLPMDVIAVRSADQSTLYSNGVDYQIVPSSSYHGFALTRLSNASQAFTITGPTVLITYNRFLLAEHVTEQSDTVTLSGSTPAALSQLGFLQNSWLPASHGDTDLLLDGYLGAGVTPAANSLMASALAPASRYIKLVVSNLTTVTPLEGRDFQLTVDPNTGAATVARVIGGNIPDGSSVEVTYYYSEALAVASNYPAYVQQVANSIAATNDAGADILVKAMIASPVDITMAVTLDGNTSPEDVDGTIRTSLANALYRANQSYAQSQGVKVVQQITGVTDIGLPLLKCAKSDGAYDIASVIPVGTPWTPLASDPAFANIGIPANAFLTAAPVLQNQTIASGGTANAYVGLLYEGQSYARTLTLATFLASQGPSFYMVGADDVTTSTVSLNATYPGRILLSNSDGTNPGLLAYRATYQCFGESGAKDITTASSEYLVPGTIQILYS